MWDRICACLFSWCIVSFLQVLIWMSIPWQLQKLRSIRVSPRHLVIVQCLEEKEIENKLYFFPVCLSVWLAPFLPVFWMTYLSQVWHTGNCCGFSSWNHCTIFCCGSFREFSVQLKKKKKNSQRPASPDAFGWPPAKSYSLHLTPVPVLLNRLSNQSERIWGKPPPLSVSLLCQPLCNFFLCVFVSFTLFLLQIQTLCFKIMGLYLGYGHW